MTFDLFASPTKDDIKVGYIDPTLGYVDGVTICEANDYAKNNPGTTFVFRDGDNNLKYLNINEVNDLTANDLVSTASTCGGIQQYKECGPPRIQFFGGGGIGASGNPIIGRDGSLLAVDVVRGGYGYQYPPIVAAKDDCQFGNGAVLTAVLGETADQTEVYEGEEDFEEYELCEETDVGYGIKYGPNGEELGAWEPQVYTRVGADPIQREIEIFQKAIQKPFWTTRKVQPDRITSLEGELGIIGGTQQYPNSYNVTHTEWGEFMNKYAISPVKPSDVTGSDEAGKVFSMEWELNFPVSGEYIFRGVCDNSSKVFIDGSLVGELKSFKDNPSPLQKTVQEGNHILKVDLLNVPITETKITSTPSASNLQAKFILEGSSAYLQVDGTGSGEISFVMDVNDASYIAGLAAREVIIPSDSGKVRFTRETNEFNSVNAKNQTIGQPVLQGTNVFALTEETIKKSGTFTAGRKYGPIEIIGAGVGARGPIINSKNRLGIRDADGDDENIKITIASAKGSSSSTIEVGQVVSPKSWNENPMGVSMIIDAPTPPVPQEPLPPAVGECPPNPIWSTRFPGASQQWYPVRNKSWSDFCNRYAISPILPLNTPGSDNSGVTFSNSWTIDLPYSGFYGVKGTRDNNGRVLIDGNEVSKLDGFRVNNPKISKVFLEKGRHTITVEIFNNPLALNSTIDTKIFSTQDWRVPSESSSSNLQAKFILEGSSAYLQVDGNGKGEISFVMDVNDASYIAGLAAREVRIPSDSGKVKFERKSSEFLGQTLDISIPTEETIKASGTFTAGRKYGPIEIIGAGVGALGPVVNSNNRLGIKDASGDDENIKITITGTKGSSTTTPISQSPTKNGVTYSGPALFGHIDKRWSKYMNEFSVSPSVNTNIGKFTLTWKQVNFPYNGLYKFNLQSDNVAKLIIGGKEIFTSSDFVGEKIQYTFNITSGKYDVVIELENIASGGKGDSNFISNPMGVALFISKDVVFSDNNKTSWIQNPIGVSAILIPPPCAKRIGGKGVVDRVIVNDPGNGYLPPKEQGPGYPVTLVLDQVVVEDPGINYRCGEDQLQITPNNGAQLSYECDPFGKINTVNVLNPGIGFNIYPEITLPSETGVNARFRPVFRVLRDPLLPPDKLIQVTDLVGLKQTGYVDGRAYFGAVYYDEGVAYAGYYKTAGPQTRVYTTLQESITAQVTTPPSAIQRSGTDITSNDPRLNIPGTIQDTET